MIKHEDCAKHSKSKEERNLYNLFHHPPVMCCHDEVAQLHVYMLFFSLQEYFSSRSMGCDAWGIK